MKFVYIVVFQAALWWTATDAVKAQPTPKDGKAPAEVKLHDQVGAEDYDKLQQKCEDAGISTSIRQNICAQYMAVEMVKRAEKEGEMEHDFDTSGYKDDFKLLDNKFWLTSSEYTTQVTSQNQHDAACKKEYGMKARALAWLKDIRPSTGTGLTVRQAQILSMFWDLTGDKGDNYIMMNMNVGQAITNGKSTAVTHLSEAEVVEERSKLTTAEGGYTYLDGGFEMVNASATGELKLHVGCVLERAPANPELIEADAMDAVALDEDDVPMPGSNIAAPNANAKLTPIVVGRVRDTVSPKRIPSGASPMPGAAPMPGPIVAGGNGDPHFTMWSGEKFDFHGGCDLVLIDNPGFANGLGMTVHIRTKINTWWSFIETAVIRIGNDTLEVIGGDHNHGNRYWINGERGDQDLAETHTFKGKMAGFDLHFRQITKKQRRFYMDFDHKGDAVSIETFKDLVRVNIKATSSEQFKESVGIMGPYPQGTKVARDGTTVLSDPDVFGKEWQVLETEPKLFHTVGGVQHPAACEMPLPTKTKRRLGESLITEEAATVACARAHDGEKDACIFDVLATNDMDVAGSY